MQNELGTLFNPLANITYYCTLILDGSKHARSQTEILTNAIIFLKKNPNHLAMTVVTDWETVVQKHRQGNSPAEYTL